MSTSFVQRAITLQFVLGEGSFGESGDNSVTVSGLRVQCDIIKAGGASLGNATIRVLGLTDSIMNKLSTLGKPISFERRNLVNIFAGDVGSSQLPQVFQGTIQNAYADFDAMPEAAFIVDAYVAAFDAAKPISASSYKGSADIATIMGQLAAQFNPPLTFENSQNISIQLSNPYFYGSVVDQVRRAADAANINYLIDNGTLAIWPKNSFRNGDSIAVSPDSGLRGYPKFTGLGIQFEMLFNPSLAYGRKVLITSDLQPACGEWVIYKLSYGLDSQLPGGRWFCNVDAASTDLLGSTGGILPIG